MILFLGDSFTWGQGLEWYLLLEKGWTKEQINKVIPPNHHNEHLPIELNDYREKNRWARLVAEHFDIGYDLGRYTNGGTNGDLYEIINNLAVLPDNIKLIVLQFTHSGRHTPLTPENVNKLFEDDTDIAIKTIKRLKERYPYTKIVTVSWLPELGELMESKMGEKYVIKINSDNNISYGFEDLAQVYNIYHEHKLNDYHLTKEGNKILARNVIEHIEKYNLLQKNDFYESKGIKIL
tara:strand:+ start:1690 stop:2397 length:708 start_codon:yes stop_codon:yes gene_type:complete